MRLIDMDETIKQLRDYADRKHANGHTDTANSILQAVSYIRNNMVRVDAVEVVRCKDCEWFAPNNNGSWIGCQMYNAIRIVPEDAPGPDDYCSYGEAKSGTQPQREDV